MDFKQSKISNRMRKSNKLFSCKTSEDSRIQRALEKKQVQKQQRAKTVSKLRQLNTPAPNSRTLRKNPERNTKKYTREEIKELAQIRYQNMLKRKEEKKKALLREKIYRKPAFVTGLYQPDRPKFLISVDDTTKEPFKATPFKVGTFSSTKSSCKRVLRSSAKPGNVFRTARPLQFHLGITPVVQNKSQTSTFDKKNQSLRKAKFDLGVQPLPKSPQLFSKQDQRKDYPSFAPQNFQFQAPEGLDATFLKRKVLGLLNDSSSQQFIDNSELSKDSSQTALLNDFKGKIITEVEENKENLVEEVDEEPPLDAQSIRRLTMNAGSTPCSFSKVFQRKTSNHSFVTSNNSFVHNSDAMLESSLEVESTTSNAAEVSDVNTDSTNNLNHAQPSIPGSDSSSSSGAVDMDKDNALLGASTNRRLTMNAGVTPGPITRSRGSRKKSFVTPPQAKLRPRTPCSRSTRRSRMVHCDDLHLNFSSFSETPASCKRKSKKKSVTLSTRVVMIGNDSKQEDCKVGERIDIAAQEYNSITPKVPTQDVEFNPQKSPIPLNSQLSPRASSALASSNNEEATPVTLPWVTKSRGSSSMRRNLRKTGHMMNDLEIMFSDVKFDHVSFNDLLNETIPPDNNEVATSDVYEPKNLPDETGVPSDFLVACERNEGITGTEAASSVWSPDLLESASSLNISTIQELRECLSEISPNLKVNDSILAEPLLPSSENVSNLQQKQIFRRRSCRVSFGIFSKLEDSNPKEDVEASVKLDSPLVPISAPHLHPQHKRRTKRVSAAQSLASLKENQEMKTVVSKMGRPSDSISWESPAKSASTACRNSKDDSTPIRRSTRQSRIYNLIEL